MDNTNETAEPSGASGGYAPPAGWVPSEGDIVRVRNLNKYVVSFARKVADRDAVVIRCFEVAARGFKMVRLRFLKRNGRGKEFEETLRASDVIQWPTGNA
jgi:hypothetical protein